MKAMVLAAGLGTRLRPLTNDRPKALVEVGGRTLLEITLARLREFGIREVIVNVHYIADTVMDYLQENKNFGMRIEISLEQELLDTGGGLKKAAWFFLEDAAARDEPFILHNVDVVSTIDLRRMISFHGEQHALATLAVQERETSRYLLFDNRGQLCGRRARKDGPPEIVRGAGSGSPMTALAFSGVHVISSRIFSLMTEDGTFSIIPAYLRLAGLGEKIVSFRTDECYWRDLGRPQNVAQLEEDIKSGLMRSRVVGG
jgi:NDP-sugar pyrophosphorylase family protein